MCSREEIERCLLALPGIDDALVMPVKDPLFGERPLAILKAEGGGIPKSGACCSAPGSFPTSFPDHWLSWPDESVLKPPIAKWQTGRRGQTPTGMSGSEWDS